MSEPTPPRFREVLLALTLSAIVGFVVGLPHLLIPLTHPGQPYSPLAVDGVSLLTFEETMSFAGETREVLDGHWPVRDAQTYEHKNDPAPFPLLPPLVSAGLARLTGSMNGAFIVADFLFPALTVFFAFLLLKRFAGRGAFGLLAGAAIVVGIDLFQKFPPFSRGSFLALLEYLAIDGRETVPLAFSRFFYPELPVMLLLLVGWLFLEALARRRRGWTAAAGIAFGAAIWTYAFTWTAIAAGLILFLLVAALRREWADVRLVTAILGLGAVVGIPVWWQTASFWLSPNHADVFRRLGEQTGRFLNVNRSLQYALFGLLAAFAFRRPTAAQRFLLLVLVGGVLCLQAQLLTGSTFQSWHWASRVLAPWSFVLLAAVLAAVTRDSRFVRLGVTGLTAALIGWGALWQTVYAVNVAPDHVRPSPYNAAFAWLNEHATKDDVVGSVSMATNALIVSRTSANVLVPFGGETVETTDEIIDRAFVTYRIHGFTPETVRRWFAFDPERSRALAAACGEKRCRLDWAVKDTDATANLTTFTWLRVEEGAFRFSQSLAMPTAEVDRTTRRYEEFPTDPNDVLGRYRFDYLIVGPNERRHGEVDDAFSPFLEPVYRDGGVEVDRVKRTPS